MLSKKENYWAVIVSYTVMISAFLPKIVISEGVNIFFAEIILFLGFFKGIKQFIFYKEQKYLLILFGSILFFSIVTQNYLSDMGAILRSVKELLYIPIIYWVSRIKNTHKIYLNLIKCGLLAYIVNLFFYWLNYSATNTIWSAAETLSSGMSNRGFSIRTMSIVQFPSLAHGIWGGYTILIFIITLYLYQKKIIKLGLFFIISLLFLITTGISISRETLLILIIIIFCHIFFSRKNLRSKILIIVFIVLACFYLFTLGTNLPIMQKLLYTQTSIQELGTEGNIQIRINTWKAYFNFLEENMEYFFMGFGLSSENFYNHIKNYGFGILATVPESVIVYSLAYGGVLSLISFVALVLRCYKQMKIKVKYKILKYFFLGVLVVNLFSGVSMFSDLLYAHLCLVYGLILNKNRE